MELEEISKILTPRDGEENQEINDIPVIEDRLWNKMAQWSPVRQTCQCPIQTKFGTSIFNWKDLMSYKEILKAFILV